MNRLYSVFYTTVMCVLSLASSGEQSNRSLREVDESVNYRFYYTHTHLRDTTTAESRITENMVLFTGDRYALFCSYDKLILEKTWLEKSAIHALQRAGTPFVITRGPEVILQEFITAFDDPEYIRYDYLGRDFYVLDTKPLVDWELLEGEKEHLGMTAYPAKTKFLGRTWEVWFVPELAIPSGPWLLYGLPGLIVEAKDSTNQITYELTGYESAKVENEVVEGIRKEWNYDRIRVHKLHYSDPIKPDDFLKMLETMEKVGVKEFSALQDEIKFKRKQFRSNYSVYSNPRSWTNIISNPIDLTSNIKQQ